jgi:hypothetical protein
MIHVYKGACFKGFLINLYHNILFSNFNNNASLSKLTEVSKHHSFAIHDRKCIPIPATKKKSILLLFLGELQIVLRFLPPLRYHLVQLISKL